MPLLEDNVEVIPPKSRKYVPAWYFEHTWLGYQVTTRGVFIYRFPTLRECLQYSKAAAVAPMTACTILLSRIGLLNTELLDDLPGEEVAVVVRAMLAECYPSSDEVFNEIDAASNKYNSDLVGAMETFTAGIGDMTPILDLNIKQAIERVGLAQIMLEQRIRPDEKSNKRPRRQQQEPSEPARRPNAPRPRDTKTGQRM